MRNSKCVQIGRWCVQNGLLRVQVGSIRSFKQPFVYEQKAPSPLRGRGHTRHLPQSYGALGVPLQAWAVRTTHTGGMLSCIQRLGFFGTSRVGLQNGVQPTDASITKTPPPRKGRGSVLVSGCHAHPKMSRALHSSQPIRESITHMIGCASASIRSTNATPSAKTNKSSPLSISKPQHSKSVAKRMRSYRLNTLLGQRCLSQSL